MWRLLPQRLLIFLLQFLGSLKVDGFAVRRLLQFFHKQRLLLVALVQRLTTGRVAYLGQLGFVGFCQFEQGIANASATDEPDERLQIRIHGLEESARNYITLFRLGRRLVFPVGGVDLANGRRLAAADQFAEAIVVVEHGRIVVADVLSEIWREISRENWNLISNCYIQLKKYIYIKRI